LSLQCAGYFTFQKIIEVSGICSSISPLACWGDIVLLGEGIFRGYSQEAREFWIYTIQASRYSFDWFDYWIVDIMMMTWIVLL